MPQPATPPPPKKFQVYREKTFLSSVKLMIEIIFRHGMIEDQCLLCESLHMVKWCKSLQYVYTLHVLINIYILQSTSLKVVINGLHPFLLHA